MATSFLFVFFSSSPSVSASPVEVIKKLPSPDQPDGPLNSTPANNSSMTEASNARATTTTTAATTATVVSSSAPHWPELDGQTADGERLPCIADMQGFMRVHFDSVLDGASSVRENIFSFENGQA